MTKNILIICGHPSAASFNGALATAYGTEATMRGHEVRTIFLGELSFDPVLHHGYNLRQELEPDLKKCWESITWASHIVWVFPVWWGMPPALLKGFLDRLLLPGLAFKYRPDSPIWDKLLSGKTTEVISTIDYPIWYFRWLLREGGVSVFQKMTLEFCGLKVKRKTFLGPIRGSSESARKSWLRKVTKLAGQI